VTDQQYTCRLLVTPQALTSLVLRLANEVSPRTRVGNSRVGGAAGSGVPPQQYGVPPVVSPQLCVAPATTDRNVTVTTEMTAVPTLLSAVAETVVVPTETLVTVPAESTRATVESSTDQATGTRARVPFNLSGAACSAAAPPNTISALPGDTMTSRTPPGTHLDTPLGRRFLGPGRERREPFTPRRKDAAFRHGRHSRDRRRPGYRKVRDDAVLLPRDDRQVDRIANGEVVGRARVAAIRSHGQVCQYGPALGSGVEGQDASDYRKPGARHRSCADYHDSEVRLHRFPQSGPLDGTTGASSSRQTRRAVRAAAIDYLARTTTAPA